MNTARRQSNALSVGSTPLNKVITIILAAQKTSPAYVAHALDEVSKLGYIFSERYLLKHEITMSKYQMIFINVLIGFGNSSKLKLNGLIRSRDRRSSFKENGRSSDERSSRGIIIGKTSIFSSFFWLIFSIGLLFYKG